ncbi:MAG: YdbL family protein [Deltaproteobacteria bacterium]|nr:YdbL family protein [Deltaproteobacteria bacterium]
MNKKLSVLLLVTLSLIIFISQNVMANSIQERMKERLPLIVELKKAGIIGENNLGYLEYVSAAKKMEDVVTAENNDRKLVYEAIAKKQNTTADLVGKRRALQIAEKADPGEWLKNEGGKWYKK